MRQLCFILVLLSTQVVYGQHTKRDKLEQERKQILTEIKAKKTQLKQTVQEKKLALVEKQKINQALLKNQTVVGSLKKDVCTLEGCISRTECVMGCLDDDLVKIKKEYQKKWQSIYCQYRFHPVLVPDATKINDVSLKNYYLQTYKNFRQREILAIRATQNDLVDKKESNEQQLDHKSTVLDHESQKQLKLHTDLQQKNIALTELAETEKILAKTIEKRQKAHEDLNLAIETIIRDEMNRRLAASRTKKSKGSGLMTASLTKSTKANTNLIVETPESTELSNGFSSNKGKLPWPVEKGFISKKYGVQPHQELKSIMVKNNGIDIATDAGAKVRSVFGGSVVGVMYVPGCKYVVLVQHGSFYTVYSNLEKANVKIGDAVKTKQTIGTLASTGTNNEVHFEVWKDKLKMDPSIWVNK